MKVSWDEVRRTVDKIDPHAGTPREWNVPFGAQRLSWTRETVPLSRVSPVEPHSSRDVKRYAKRSQATQPPILLIPDANGYLYPVDGAHRVSAARLRGDTEIDAFVGRCRLKRCTY